MKKFQVLIADDERRIINFLTAKLRASGYEVITAGNGEEALEQIQAQEPDLIVLDVVMPRMDGFETLKRLRSFSAVPVIMLSAKGTNADRIKGLGLGADDYLAKPFSPDELIARIEAVRRRLAPGRRTSSPTWSHPGRRSRSICRRASARRSNGTMSYRVYMLPDIMEGKPE